uniref:Uncharacterized protein n=1 Tax=Clytia hemisphaerica TaxID=252671 RepID=A0A7M5UPY2_9CNID
MHLIIAISCVLLAFIRGFNAETELDVELTKNEMIQLLGTLNGDQASSVPDFLFFTQEGQIDYIQTKGPPRTEKPTLPGSKPKPPKRSDAEITLSKALNRIQKGHNVPVIEKWAKVLDLLLFTDLTAAQRDCSIDRIVRNADTSINTCKNSDGSSTSGKSSTSGGSSGNKGQKGKQRKDEAAMEEKFENEAKRMEISYQDIKEEVKEYLEDLENTDDDENYGAESESESFDEIEDTEEHFARRFQRDLKRSYRRNVYQPGNIVQTLDTQRMRRGLTYRYSNYGQCFTEGSEGATSDTVRLCQTCYHTIDFGEDVVPQYANSVECSDSATMCISGDGTCTQKVIYYSFKKLVDSVSNTWESYQQPLNVSCECECIANSMTHMYMVGDSN